MKNITSYIWSAVMLLLMAFFDVYFPVKIGAIITAAILYGICLAWVIYTVENDTDGKFLPNLVMIIAPAIVGIIGSQANVDPSTWFK